MIFLIVHFLNFNFNDVFQKNIVGTYFILLRTEKFERQLFSGKGTSFPMENYLF